MMKSDCGFLTSAFVIPCSTFNIQPIQTTSNTQITPKQKRPARFHREAEPSPARANPRGAWSARHEGRLLSC
jgi:hypothetical protein